MKTEPTHSRRLAAFPSTVLLLLACLCPASAAHARDWFVRAGADGGGDGSRAKPFRDPYLALEKAEAGDAIHVAQGAYHGKLDCGNWVVAVPNLAMLGGYDAEFAARDPWKHPTELRFAKAYNGRNTGTLVAGERDHTNFVLDGFVMDCAERNSYAPSQYGDLKPAGAVIPDPVASFASPGVQVRNCLVLNGAGRGLDVAGGSSVVENNVVMNMAGDCLLSVRAAAAAANKPVVVRNNTLMFCWSEVASGGPDGIGLRLSGRVRAELVGNVIYGCDNHGLVVPNDFDRVVLKDNVFHLNGHSHVKLEIAGRRLMVDDVNMDELEDVGFAECAGNTAEDPGLDGLDPQWMLRRIARATSLGRKQSREAWDRLRPGYESAAGAGKAPEAGFAMAYDWRRALALVPKVSQGAHPIKLEVKLTGPSSAATVAAAQYEPSSWEAFMADPQSLDGKRVQIAGVFGGGRSFYPYAGIGEKEYRGFHLWDVQERSGLPPVMYVRRGSNAEKLLDATLPWDGRGLPSDRFTFRGVVRYDPTATVSFKGTLVVDSVEPYAAPAAPARRRAPAGRDWFVRAGSSGGDGSRAKPFKDSWQALDAALPGDSVHVAAGEYFGKLSCGFWTVATRDLTLLGGYDKQFAERDPWKHPTRLRYRAESRATLTGTYLTGDGDHSGLIVDGFVLDGKDMNAYGPDGALDPSHSPRQALIELKSPDCVVRNCVLLNGSLGSVTLGGEGCLVENNILVNFNTLSLRFSQGQRERPATARNNTILFTWEPRRMQGRSSSGSGIYFGSDPDVVVDRNLIAFHDGQGVFTNSPARRVRVTNNVFGLNLFAHVTNLKDLVFDDATFDRMGDAGFAACEGNSAGMDPRLPVDRQWAANYLAWAMKADSDVTAEQWARVHESLGLPPPAKRAAAAADAPKPEEPAKDERDPKTGKEPKKAASLDDLLADLDKLKVPPKPPAEPGVVFSPAYDWEKALTLFPGDPHCEAGARRQKLEVRFNPAAAAATGAPRPKSYRPVEWPVIQKNVATLAGQDVQFVGRLGEARNEFYVPDLKATEYVAVQVSGPQGIDSGLPIVAYARKGSQVEKALQKAEVRAAYTFRGVARQGVNFPRGCLVLESLEPAAE